jgi:hypothetical protein
MPGQSYLYFIVIILFAVAIPARSQNTKNNYYIIRKSDVDNGKVKIIYRDPNDSVRKLKMCYDRLKAEGLEMVDGVPVFHFTQIKSAKFDSTPDCISNSTPLGQFEIDVKQDYVGDPHKTVRLPYRSINWNASLTLYKIRPAEHGNPVFAVSDPATMLVSVMYGYTVGTAKINHVSITHYFLTVGPFLGVTSASLTGTTVKHPALLPTDQSNVAFSYGLSSILGRNNFGFTFSFGFDVALGKNAGEWIYQNKPWLGIGVSAGLSVFQK